VNNIPFSASTPVGPVRTQYVLPAFSLAPTWTGVSGLLARYPLGNTGPLSLKRPIVHPEGEFVLAISYAESPYVFRYKLADQGDTLKFPVYAGEQLEAGAYLEVWSTADETAVLASDFTLESSVLNETSCNTMACTQPTSVVTLTATPFTEVPADQECNPFCSPLCV